MEMRKCINGHYFDASIHAMCPYCDNKNEVGLGADARPVPAYWNQPMQDDERTLPIGYSNQGNRNFSSGNSGVNTDDDNDKTVAIIHRDMGVDPVVGWLVCLNNSQKGRDYRIHSDNNYIGRSERMDICIRGDETISRENHAIISYDGRNNIFYFSLGDGRSIVKLNDTPVFSAVELKAYDIITIGNTNLVFIPLCTDKFEWGAGR